MAARPGDQLLQLCSAAGKDLLLVAPFIKVGVITRVLDALQDETSLTVVTRWRFEEIAAGVSDLEVYEALTHRGHPPPQLRQDLHAKYYRSGTRCLIGSANLTALALGWRAPGNYELLIEAQQDAALRAWEQELFEGCLPADSELVEALTAALEDLEIRPELSALDQVDASIPSFEAWLPETRHPDNLYAAYTNTHDLLSAGAMATAAADIAALGLPPTLIEPLFSRAVALRLLTHPVVRELDIWLSQDPRRFGEVVDWLTPRIQSAPSRRDVGTMWQTLLRWILFFLPGRYELRVHRHTEVLHRVI